MGLRLKIEGSESVNLPETSIERVKFGADIPHDSNARSTDLGSSILITGKILASVNGEAADDTSKLARWSLIPAENSDCYRKVQIDVVNPECVCGRLRRGFYGRYGCRDISSSHQAEKGQDDEPEI